MVAIRTGHQEVDEVIILLVIVVVAVSVPLASVVLVSLASKREDSARSLGGRPAGPLEAVARRMVGFHGDGVACRPGARLSHSRPSHAERGGPGLNSTGFYGAGLDSTRFDSTRFDSTDLNGAAFLADNPDVPHLVS